MDDSQPQQPIRLALKLSGESLMGRTSYGIDPTELSRIIDDIIQLHELGYQLAIIIGGGNIFRGVSGASQGIDRNSADGMGMLATVINSLALQSAFEEKQIDTRIMSAIAMQSICEPFVQRRAIRHLEKRRIVICAAGTGNPYFSTDTAAVLRASELKCKALLKGTMVDGVYNKDPKKFSDAKLISTLTFSDALKMNIRVMDSAAFALAGESNIPIVVFSILKTGNLLSIAKGEGTCSYVAESEKKINLWHHEHTKQKG